MKPRARRITIGVALAGVGVLALLVVLNWNSVRDHVEAWHFQLTHEIASTEPVPEPKVLGADYADYEVSIWHEAGQRRVVCEYSTLKVCQLLAKHAGFPVIYALNEKNSEVWSPRELAGETAQKALQEDGYRVLEQRFPRRAYVVIRDEESAQQ